MDSHCFTFRYATLPYRSESNIEDFGWLAQINLVDKSHIIK